MDYYLMLCLRLICEDLLLLVMNESVFHVQFEIVISAMEREKKMD
jgi:hypothetical protein